MHYPVQCTMCCMNWILKLAWTIQLLTQVKWYFSWEPQPHLSGTGCHLDKVTKSQHQRGVFSKWHQQSFWGGFPSWRNVQLGLALTGHLVENIVLSAASLALWYLGSDFKSCYKIGTLCTFGSRLAQGDRMNRADFLLIVILQWRWTCLFWCKLCVARFVG